MKDCNSIEVKNIKKSFKVYYDRSNSFKDFFIHSSRRHSEVREVIKDVSFEIKKGEAVGLIGRNGCGKSTTLKMLTKIMYPDAGTIEMRGRVTSLIELGAGFHPDMSGRENIYINASIFGLSKAEIDSRLNDIIDFSELHDYIDNPVRTYSSGMYMRLAFAVAINVDADILLIDEILAVGDISFQSKCFKKLKQIKEQGTTIVIVSHSLGQIETICDTTIWLEDGYIKMQGRPKMVHSCYVDAMEEGVKEIIGDIPPEELKRRMRLQEDKITSLKNELKTAFDLLDKNTYPMELKALATAYRVKAANVNEQEVIDDFLKTEPDQEKRYLYFGCYGTEKVIKELRSRGYNVYGYEAEATEKRFDNVIWGKDNISDMRFDDVFVCPGYFEMSETPEEDRKLIEKIKSPERTIEMLPRLIRKDELEPIGEHGGVRINAGSLIYGPYCTLYDARYKLHYKIKTPAGNAPKRAILRVATDVGEWRIKEAAIRETEGCVDFILETIVHNMEFVVEADPNEELIVDQIDLECVG